jgi:hypothetical protein
LSNSEIVDHGGGRHETVLPAMAGAWLVYPLGEPLAEPPVPPPRTLVFLDATWSQARRMYRKLDGLRGLPILHLPDAPMAAARLRASPGPGRVSTLEAVARALRLVEGDAVADPLDQLFDVAVERARRAGRRSVNRD